MLYVLILYISGGTYSLKSTPNDRFEKLFMAILFTLRVFARNLLRENRQRNTFRILFWCPAWDSNPGFSSNKPTHYLLDHGDFIMLTLRYRILFDAKCIKIEGAPLQILITNLVHTLVRLLIFLKTKKIKSNHTK